jgi:hypothetical protein
MESYNRIAGVLTAKAKRLNSPNTEYSEFSNELIDALIDIRKKIKQGNMSEMRVTNGTVIIDENDSCRLRFQSIAPGARSISKYEDSLKACFDKTNPARFLADSIDSVNHNDISSGFVLEYGSQRIVFGGDIENPEWQDVLQNPPAGIGLQSDLIKVSHHGSETGYCERLWEDYLSPTKQALSVVTPFSCHNLPNYFGLQHLLNNSKRVVTTSLSAAQNNSRSCKKPNFIETMPLDAQQAVLSIYKPASNLKKQGRCSFTLNGNTSLSCEFYGDAGEISTTHAI